MSGIFGRMSGQPLAVYDHELQCWKTSEDTCLWALPMSLETVPPMGYLYDGSLYELPMLGRHIIERVFSSLLPTPNSRDHKGSPSASWSEQASLPRAVKNFPTPKAADGERGRDLPRLRADLQSRELATAVGHLLPTPTSQAARHGETPDLTANAFGANLWDLPHLLPTPAVNDMGAGKDPKAWKEWAARQKAADGTPAPHGKSLEQEALSISETTTQLSDDGKRSLDDPHLIPLFDAMTESD